MAADLGRFFDLAPDLMVIVDDRGRFVRVNDAFVRTLGYPAGELTERPSVEFIHPDDLDETLAHYPVHVASSASLGFDSRFRHRNGSYRSLRGTATALEDGYIYATAADVTDRKRDEDRAAQFAAIVESCPDTIIGLSCAGTIESWNPGAERLYGYAADEAVGQAITIVNRPESPHELSYVRKAVAGNTVKVETTNIRRDGRPVEVALAISPVRRESGEVIGISCLAQDVSARRRLERDAQRLAAAAEHGTDAVISIDSERVVRHWNKGRSGCTCSPPTRRSAGPSRT